MPRPGQNHGSSRESGRLARGSGRLKIPFGNAGGWRELSLEKGEMLLVLVLFEIEHANGNGAADMDLGSELEEALGFPPHASSPQRKDPLRCGP